MCGGTIAKAVQFLIEPMNPGGQWRESLVDCYWKPQENAAVVRVWDAFVRWFHGVPGLGMHTFVRIGLDDDEPGAVMPRLVVALTPAGSIVGAASSVVLA